MDFIFSILQYLGYGVLGLIALMILVTMIFGKRVRKTWEYDADFLDAKGKEIGEFDIELSKIEKVEEDFSLKAKLRLRHASLVGGATVQVFVDGSKVMTGKVESAGKVFLPQEQLNLTCLEIQEGQICRVVCDGKELCRAELVPD